MALQASLLPTADKRTVSAPDALGKALAAPLIARDNHPRFDNSAVDGYAVIGRPARKGDEMLVESTVYAGNGASSFRSGTCVRVMTGAVVPEGTIGVAMQEDVDVRGDTIRLMEDI